MYLDVVLNTVKLNNKRERYRENVLLLDKIKYFKEVYEQMQQI